MAEDDRFRIGELVAQYSLHPDLRDVYVEGEIDKAVMSWLLPELHLQETVAVYPIDAVDVPAEVVRKHNQREGERGEVVALAMELREQLGKGHEHLTLIADADYGYVLDSLEDCSLLLYTDGTTLDLYAFNEHTVEKFLRMTLGGFRYSASEVLAVLSPVLVERFLARATNESLGWAMRWPRSLKSVTVRADGTVGFDAQRFVRNYLSQNQRQADGDTFLGELNRLRGRMGEDTRKYVGGKDFAALLGRFIGRWVRHDIRNQFSSGAVVAAALRSCLEMRTLREEPMFLALAARLS